MLIAERSKLLGGRCAVAREAPGAKRVAWLHLDDIAEREESVPVLGPKRLLPLVTQLPQEEAADVLRVDRGQELARDALGVLLTEAIELLLPGTHRLPQAFGQRLQDVANLHTPVMQTALHQRLDAM